MKIIFLIFLLITQYSYSQYYKLLPDSCTSCLYFFTDGNGGKIHTSYSIDPKDSVVYLDTIKYIKFYGELLLGVRQVENKVFGYFYNDTIEKLIMNFDANVGDTIKSLFSDQYYYDAIVIAKDSNEVAPSVYHHWLDLKLGNTYPAIDNYPSNYVFRWSEKGLCSEAGGYCKNIPVNSLLISGHGEYHYEGNCTSDSLVPDSFINFYACDNCGRISSWNVEEIQLDTKKQIVKIIDLLGREVEPTKCQMLIYIFSDGTSKKYFIYE